MSDNFIMINKKVVWNDENRKDTFTYEYGEKIPYILSYLDSNINRVGQCKFSIEDMVMCSGLKSRTGKGNSNEQFKKILIDLQVKKIIECNKDISLIKASELITCKFNMLLQKDSEGNNCNFFTVETEKYINIIESDTKLNKLTLIKIYYYILSRLWNRNDNGNYVGGRAEVFYDNLNSISDDLFIATDTFNEYVKELNRLQLIFIGNIGLVTKDGKTKMANNVYSKEIIELKRGLEISKLYYIDNDYVIIGKKNSSEINKINGLKGKINSEINKGNDITLLEEKLTKLINNKEKKEE